MKKLFILSLIINTLSFNSCSNNDEELFVPSVNNNQTDVTTNFVEENPFASFIEQANYNDFLLPCTNNSDVYYNVGLLFKPTSKGTINSLVVKLPVVNNSLEITLWDFTSKTKIRTEIMNVAIANQETTKNIIPIELIKNKKYIISMKTNSYYLWHEANWTQPKLPLKCGNIEITTPISSIENSSSMPSSGSGNFCNGECSFYFLRTE